MTPEELEALHHRGLMQAENAAGDSFHCRSADCNGFCFYEDEVNEFDCPLCKKRNCLLCKAIHEDMNCQEYQEDLKRRAENDAAAKATQDMLEVSVHSFISSGSGVKGGGSDGVWVWMWLVMVCGCG